MPAVAIAGPGDQLASRCRCVQIRPVQGCNGAPIGSFIERCELGVLSSSAFISLRKTGSAQSKTIIPLVNKTQIKCSSFRAETEDSVRDSWSIFYKVLESS